MMKVLVTGASGNGGRYVIRELVKLNEPVVAAGTNIQKLRDIFGNQVEPVYLKYRNYYIKKRGLDKAYVDVTVALYFMTRMGTAKEMTNHFYELTRRKPRTFEEFSKDKLKYFY